MGTYQLAHSSTPLNSPTPNIFASLTSKPGNRNKGHRFVPCVSDLAERRTRPLLALKGSGWTCEPCGASSRLDALEGEHRGGGEEARGEWGRHSEITQWKDKYPPAPPPLPPSSAITPPLTSCTSISQEVRLPCHLLFMHCVVFICEEGAAYKLSPPPPHP